jgi:hypothetical protein
MNKFKIKSETRETFGSYDVKTLKVLIILTKCLKAIHTEMAIFIGTALAPLSVAIYMYSNGTGFFIFPVAMVIHFIVFKLVKYWFFMDNNSLEETYEEQSIIQDELEAILSEKRS